MVVGDEEEVDRQGGSNDDGSTTFCPIVGDGVTAARNPYYEPLLRAHGLPSDGSQMLHQRRTNDAITRR